VTSKNRYLASPPKVKDEPERPALPVNGMDSLNRRCGWKVSRHTDSGGVSVNDEGASRDE
jgi:hypothetical protein